MTRLAILAATLIPLLSTAALAHRHCPWWWPHCTVRQVPEIDASTGLLAAAAVFAALALAWELRRRRAG